MADLDGYHRKLRVITTDIKRTAQSTTPISTPTRQKTPVNGEKRDYRRISLNKRDVDQWATTVNVSRITENHAVPGSNPGPTTPKLLQIAVLDRARKGLHRAYVVKKERLPYVRGRLGVRGLVQRP